MASLDDATRTMIRNLEEKTGRNLGDWADLANTSGHEKHGQIVAWLKSEHGLGHGYANLVALESRGGLTREASEEDAVAAVFAGEKAALRPLYDVIEAWVKGLGGDVEIAPKKANVSVRRSKQFALIQPSRKTRMDLGLQLKGVTPSGRLEASGSWNAMVSHRVRLEDAAAFDSEVRGWLKAAYDAA
ncbi:MAG TPA: DUF4287 domain-containing protein [Caulobacter sp.]|nr:DUF4287 domain-containing protein [Caulobacter sp.]